MAVSSEEFALGVEMSDEPLIQPVDSQEVTIDVPAEEMSEASDEGERRACLIFLSGPLMGHSVALDESPQVVGRSRQADIAVSDTGVSRRHARFYARDDGAFVEDLKSSNGVYVNGERVERFHHLEEGDKITLGSSTILKFSYYDSLDEDFQQRLLESVIKDPLTGLYNRAQFDRQLDSELHYAKRHDTRLALIIFDLDHFKELNDTHGHLAGDAALEQLGELLLDSTRDEDFLARYGGEEFAMIGRGLTVQQGVQAAERLRRIVEEARFSFEDLTFQMTLSAGVAAVPAIRAASPAELIEAADQALYRAKQDGRNCTRSAREQ